MFNRKCVTNSIIFFVIYLGNAATDDVFDLPQIKLPQGTVVGYWGRTDKNYTFKAFEGIPYAKPPIGDLRFKEPQPLEQWSGIWVANMTTKCLQYNHIATPYRVDGDENCLFLNIYTPSTATKESLLNVIIHIHGGGFTFGSGYIWSPNIIMEYPVVYININYRLGPLGFLSTEDNIVPGNNGLKDQTMALEWIKDNIIYFGGNPESITLTGMSAGGASVIYHLISPMSKGLFNKAFAISGSCLNPWAQAEGSLEKAKKLAASVGCNTKNVENMIECLREKPGHQIVKNVKLFQEYLFLPFSPWAPVVEKDCSNAFLCQSPYEALKRGEVQDLPLMMSAVSAEGLYPGAEFLKNLSYLTEMNDRWENLAPFILDYNYTMPVSDHKNISNYIKQFYFGNEPISLRTYPQLIQMITDRLFITTIEDTIRLLSKRKRKSPLYFHYTTFLGQTSTAIIFSNTINTLAPSHADDVNYVLPVTPVELTNENIDMRAIFLKLWLSFANTGTPQVPHTEYEPVTSSHNTYNYLRIDSPCKISMKKALTLSKSYEFWECLPLYENEHVTNF